MENRFKENPQVRRFYTMWNNMMSRCYNINHPQYKDYGGRGIKIYKRWHVFNNFLLDEWEPYYSHLQIAGEKDTTIDRINNDDGYTPENIKYSTMREQNNNRRPTNDKFYTYKGNTLNVTQWAKKYKIKYVTLLHRLNHKWSIEKALITPVLTNRYGKKKS